MPHTLLHPIKGGCFLCGHHTAAVTLRPEHSSEKFTCVECGAHPAREKVLVGRLPNVRFWTWENGGWIKITLKPGQYLRWGKHQRTEEGHSFRTIAWEYDWCGDAEPLQNADIVIREEWSDGGRDCDGAICYEGHSYWDGLSIREHDTPSGILPAWSDTPLRTLDQTAVLAGY